MIKKYKPYEQNIISFFAQGNYTQINPLKGSVSIYAKTLKKFELELSEQKQFVRVNKSVIVNLLFVNKINQDAIELCNGTIVKISRRRRKDLDEILSTHTKSCNILK
jgi:DNA-binding LytR/AlgR family response regulator